MMRLREEAGFTLVELMVAVMIMTVGLLALVGTLDSSQALTAVSERKEAVAHVAEREVEQILSQAYADVGLTSTAGLAHSTDPDNPDHYLTTASPPRFQWDRNDPTKTESLVSGGTTAPSTAWASGRLSGTVHRYVTRVDDSDCRPSCPTGAYKRVTVAVTVNGGQPKRPSIESALVVDPNDGPAADPGVPVAECVNDAGQLEVCESGGAGAYTAWHLYDTPSGSPNNYVARQAVTAGHTTHATVAATGTCTAAITTGCPRPDLMGTAAPPEAPITALFNYSTEQTALLGTYTGGRILARESTTCTGTPAADNMKSAMWVSAPLSLPKVLSGRGGMSVFTQTLAGQEAGGTLCVAVYDVPASVDNLTSTGAPPTELGRSSYSFTSWPSSLAPVSFGFNYRGASGPATVLAGRRLGVRLWLSSSSSTDKVALAYDDFDYQSIVQLNEEGP